MSNNPGPLTQTQYAPVAATALTSAVATPWLDIGGYSDVALQLDLVDADSSVERLDVDVLCAQSSAEPTVNPSLMVGAEPSAGTVTYAPYNGQINVAGSASYYLHYKLNARWVKFSVSAGAGAAAAADTLALNVRAGVGGVC